MWPLSEQRAHDKTKEHRDQERNEPNDHRANAPTAIRNTQGDAPCRLCPAEKEFVGHVGKKATIQKTAKREKIKAHRASEQSAKLQLSRQQRSSVESITESTHPFAKETDLDHQA